MGSAPFRSVAEMVWPPPSTVVMAAGTVSDVVTSPQSAVNVNVVPLVVPVHTVVMLPPGMGAALATPPPAVKTTVIVIATTARPTRNRDIPTSLLLPLWGDVRVRARDRAAWAGAVNAAAAATATRIATPNQVFHFLAMRHATPSPSLPRIPSRRRRRIDPRAFYAIESSPFGRWSEAVPLLLRVVRVVVVAVALA